MIPANTRTLIDLPAMRLTLEPTNDEWVFALGVNINLRELIFAFGPAALVMEVGRD